jgi:Ca2+-binding EF-hand superfamily protein
LELELPYVNDLFAKIDDDGSNEITYQEALHGFAMIRQSNKNDTRVLSILRHIFEVADTNGDGELQKDEFLAAFGQDSVQKKIRTNGINFELWDLETLWDKLDEDGSNALNLQETMEGYLRTREQDTSGDRAVGFLRQLFVEADLDNSGTLTKLEFQKLLKQPAAMQRLEAFGLLPTMNKTNGIVESNAKELIDLWFKELDESGDGEISCEELIESYTRIRDLLRQKSVDEETMIFAASQTDKAPFHCRAVGDFFKEAPTVAEPPKGAQGKGGVRKSMMTVSLTKEERFKSKGDKSESEGRKTQVGRQNKRATTTANLGS